MSTFVGRRADLAALEQELDRVRSTGAGRLVWLSGRRRVGKSRLVQEFCDASGAAYCFFQAPRRGREEALAEFCSDVAQSTLPAAVTFADATFGGWPAALRAAVAGATPDAPVVLVVDELLYLTEQDPGFAADLQKAWDRGLERSCVLVICVGSDVRMMDELVAERSPLHGRPTLEHALAPLDPRAVARITAAADASDAIDRYLVVGGFPLLAASWPAGSTLEDFLRGSLASDQTGFVTTAERIMAAEFADTVPPRRVIEAIGHGDSAHGRIADRSGIKENTLSVALGRLIDDKRMVARTLPYAVPPGRKPAKYTVRDPYLRFWLGFVGPHLAELSRGRGDLTVARVLRDWTAYRGRAVEPLVRDALERLLADPGFAERLGGARHVGAFWNRTHDVEVDLIGGDAPSPTAIGFVGSVKWHEREPFTRAERAALVEQRGRVPGAADARLVVVTRTGVTSGVEVDAVLGPEELLAAWD